MSNFSQILLQLKRARRMNPFFVRFLNSPDQRINSQVNYLLLSTRLNYPIDKVPSIRTKLEPTTYRPAIHIWKTPNPSVSDAFPFRLASLEQRKIRGCISTDNCKSQRQVYLNLHMAPSPELTNHDSTEDRLLFNENVLTERFSQMKSLNSNKDQLSKDNAKELFPTVTQTQQMDDDNCIHKTHRSRNLSKR